MVIRRVNSHPVPTPLSARSVETGLLPPASYIGTLDISGRQSSLQSLCSLMQLCMNLCNKRLQQIYCSSQSNMHRRQAGTAVVVMIQQAVITPSASTCYPLQTVNCSNIWTE